MLNSVEGIESDNKEVKRSKEFQKTLDVNSKVVHIIKELLDSTTVEEFSKLGFERVDKKAGVYGTGVEYGSGVEENKYQIRIAGKTDSSLEKQTFLGLKRIQSDINISFKASVVSIEYKTPENGFFRGAEKKNSDGENKSYMVNEKLVASTEDMSELKKKIKVFFKDASKREILYLSNTKLGVEGKSSTSTASIVNEEKNMEKLTLKSLFFDNSAKNINEEKNTDAVKKTNTVPFEKVTKTPKKEDKGKFLFIDADESENNKLEEILEKHKEMGQEEYKELVKSEMKKKFGTDKLNELTPVEKKEFFGHMDRIVVSKAEMHMNEMTTSGPATAAGAPSGAGGYNTPFAFKKTSYSKGKDYKRPKIDKNYNILPETKGNKDGFWTVVKVDPNYHPQGMPFVKPGSKQELANTISGDKGKMSRMGLSENVEHVEKQKQSDLTKKKMFSEAENKAKGINKRYLITEKTSDEYLKERWTRLYSFKASESIKEAEEMNEAFNESQNEILNESLQKPISIIKESVEEIIEEPKKILSENSQIGEETVNVEKPGTQFGTECKFYKKDFLNESKKYILDLNTMMFVKNPNAK